MSNETTKNNNNKNDKNDKQEKKESFIIAIVVGMAMIYLTNWFANYFYFNEVTINISSKEETLNTLETERKVLENTKKNLSLLQEHSSKLEDDYKKLSVLVPEEKDLQNVLSDLSRAGLQRNLRLSHFSQSQKIARQGAVNQVPITVSVLGSDDDISRYLFEMTRFSRIFNIDSVKFTTETNSQYAGNVNAEIKFSAFISAPVSQEIAQIQQAKANQQ
jgi:Tfp pilus assembly protein PilO